MSATVEVLLSTYNGARYVGQLLDSVRAQTYPDIDVSVRDDGSTDGTVDLLNKQLAGYPESRLVVGANLGAASSFLALLASVAESSGYAAFCDQDDVWLPDKLALAVRSLEGFDGPALYCSAVSMVTEDLSPIKLHSRCIRGPSFENALVENVVTGCTMVLNRKAIALVNQRTPVHAMMHDAWCYLVVTGCGGSVLYDPAPHVLYRIHSANAIGVGTNLWSEWSGRAWRQATVGSQRVLTAQALDLRELYGDQLTVRASQSLDDFLGSQPRLTSRLSYALRGGAYRQRRVDDLIFRALYVLHRI